MSPEGLRERKVRVEMEVPTLYSRTFIRAPKVHQILRIKHAWCTVLYVRPKTCPRRNREIQNVPRKNGPLKASPSSIQPEVRLPLRLFLLCGRFRASRHPASLPNTWTDLLLLVGLSFDFTRQTFADRVLVAFHVRTIASSTVTTTFM